jgi:hypothetical protein
MNAIRRLRKMLDTERVMSKYIILIDLPFWVEPPFEKYSKICFLRDDFLRIRFVSWSIGT